MTPTVQQQSFIEATISPAVKNILLNAKAGSGKTTTIVMAIKALPPGSSVLIGAFNRNIQQELATRTSGIRGVDCRTSHSLGRSFLPAKIAKDDNKVSRHFDRLLKEADWQWLHQCQNVAQVLKDIKALATLMRLELASTEEKLQTLCIKHGLILDSNQRAAGKELCKRVFNDLSCIDFTDMLFLPATLPLDKVLIRQYTYIFIDEAQDLNAAQWRLYKRCLAPGGKIIAVGDNSQAIYGFTGADVNAWNDYSVDAEVLPLSVCWRCSKAVIEFTNRVDKEIRAADNAIEGAVYHDANLDQVRPGDVVLCRNNAPLIKGCYSLISGGRKAMIQGTDIGANLIKFIQGFKASDLPELNHLMASKLETTTAKLLQVFPNMSLEDVVETPSYQHLHDRISCVNHMIYNVPEVSDISSLCKFIKTLFGEQTDGVLFSTVHKAKGLEWPRVFIMEPDLLTRRHPKALDWQLEQAKNLEYVAYTRAKISLHFMRPSKKGKK